MDKEIIEIVNKYTQKVKNYMPVRMIVLYGSYAEGFGRESSDIDIAVVVDQFKGDYLKASAELFNLVRGVNKRIEPISISAKNDKSGFLKSILKRGKIVYKSNN